jgi:hypothetical protein
MDGTCNVGLRFLQLCECDKSAIGAVGVDSRCFNWHGEVVLDATSMDETDRNSETMEESISFALTFC